MRRLLVALTAFLASACAGSPGGFTTPGVGGAGGEAGSIAGASPVEAASVELGIPTGPDGLDFAPLPDIVPNEARLGRFVYAGMKDYMRRVSEHVSIGRAYKGGKPMNAWFVLCREDAESS